MRELGKRIRARRLKLRLTQTDLAARVGRGYTWLVAIEKGTGNPPAELITALAVALDEDPSEYLRLAGRAVLRAEDVMPAPPLDPRVTKAIDDAVGRAMDRMAERLIAFLDERLPGTANGAAG